MRADDPTRDAARKFWRRKPRKRPSLDSRIAWKLGPSEDYVALLKGQIDAGEYIRRLKRDVNRRLRGIA